MHTEHALYAYCEEMAQIVWKCFIIWSSCYLSSHWLFCSLVPPQAARGWSVWQFVRGGV